MQQKNDSLRNSNDTMDRHVGERTEQGRTQRNSKLHMGHFAFMRAVVQGLDTRQSWDRYLRLEGEHDDIRNVKRTIQWIRDEFAAAARRSARHGTARLIQLDAGRINDKANKLPTLEDFVVEQQLDDFSQAEQLEYYKEHYGAAPSSQSRRRRLVERQLEALRWLEELAVQPPKPDDPLSSWLNPDLAERLENAGINSLEQLVMQINGIGYRWWANIPGIGAGKAERIVSWLRAQESMLGLKIGHHVDIPRLSLKPQQLDGVVKACTAIIPIEKFVAPPGLDGTTGIYRGERKLCRIDADNDVQAVFAWIKSKEKPERALHTGLTHTQRSYLKEAERFLLWAVVQQKKELSSVTTSDCQEYLGFLTDPNPREIWCGRRGREKWSPLWRPFEGPLSSAAQRHAAVVLKNLFNFLYQSGYLVCSAWEQVALPAATVKMTTRRLSSVHWEVIEQKLTELAETSINRRLAFALDLIRNTGLRLTEAVTVKTDDLFPIDTNRDTFASRRVLLRIPGRYSPQREVIIPAQLLMHLSKYLVSRGLDADPFHPSNKAVHLLGHATDINIRAPWTPEHKRIVDAKAGIAAGTMYDQLRSFFWRCAASLPSKYVDQRDTFLSASTLWLRGADVNNP